jgi:hypothetical protein
MEPDTKDWTLCDPTYVTNPEQTKLQRQKEDELWLETGGWDGVEVEIMVKECVFF